MYERSVEADRPDDALWLVEGGLTFFAGPLHYNASHQHGAPVYLVGLYDTFRLRLAGAEWLNCRAALIPAGKLHELDVGGNPIAVFYVEPDIGGCDQLLPLLAGKLEVSGAVLASRGEFALLREVYESTSGRAWIGPALDDLLAFGGQRARRDIDPRLTGAVAEVNAAAGAPIPVATFARRAGLSPSHFQRLFTRELGVPYRRYRAWIRMREAIREIVKGSNFTTAAHAAGFADQAHFAHDFRRTFGAPASQSLSHVRS